MAKFEMEIPDDNLLETLEAISRKNGDYEHFSLQMPELASNARQHIVNYIKQAVVDMRVYEAHKVVTVKTDDINLI